MNTNDKANPLRRRQFFPSLPILVMSMQGHYFIRDGDPYDGLLQKNIGHPVTTGDQRRTK